MPDHREDGFELTADAEWMQVWFTHARVNMLDDLKNAVGPMGRRWLPTERLWYIRLASWPTALKVFQRYGLFSASQPHDANHRLGNERKKNGGKTGAGQSSSSDFPPPPKPPPAPSGPWKTLYLMEGAPPEVVRAAYRALALLYHPDRGGSEIKMKELNAAYEKLPHG